VESAPPIRVVVVLVRSLAVVEESSAERLVWIACSTVAKGRYLLALSERGVVPLAMLVSGFLEPFWAAVSWPLETVLGYGEGGFGVGKSHFVRWEWLAMTATSLAFPLARCAFMKTRRLATALERGRMEERCAQACGFVSRMIARRDGGGPVQVMTGKFEAHEAWFGAMDAPSDVLI
jgi:hypothetical protein